MYPKPGMARQRQNMIRIRNVIFNSDGSKLLEFQKQKDQTYTLIVFHQKGSEPFFNVSEDELNSLLKSLPIKGSTIP